MGSPKDKDDSTTDGDATSAEPPPSSSCLFAEGERVLAYHGPCIYEAKVQKIEYRKKDSKYYVHYLGWNKNWDEWVGMDRLLKHTEENLLKQQAVEKKKGRDKNSRSGRSTQTKPKSSTDAKGDKEDLKNYVARGKKRKPESAVEKSNVSTDTPVKIQIPQTLKKQLIDDWEYVTQRDKLVKLPRSPNVDDILTKYFDYRSKKGDKMIHAIEEILKGLRCYFDKAMPLMLLYKKERQQYYENIIDNISPSTIYGAEHLLRLFVKLPELLAFVNIEQETLLRLQQTLLDFLRFLQKNQGTFFLSAYDASKGPDASNKVKNE